MTVTVPSSGTPTTSQTKNLLLSQHISVPHQECDSENQRGPKRPFAEIKEDVADAFDSDVDVDPVREKFRVCGCGHAGMRGVENSVLCLGGTTTRNEDRHQRTIQTHHNLIACKPKSVKNARAEQQTFVGD